MNRKLIFWGISICYIVLLVYGLTTVYSVGTPEPAKVAKAVKPDNKIAIAHADLFGKLERPQVIFNHKKHEDALKKEGCQTCHPVNKAGSVIFEFPKNIKQKQGKAAMNAFHDECMDCHKKMSSENKKAGPVVCADCHSEKSKDQKVEYPVVEFDFSLHDKHVKKLKEKVGKDDCGQCHHIYNPKEKDESKRLAYKEGTEESCEYCHDLEKKRGPEVSAIVKAAAQKGLSIKNVSHQECLNCHLKYQKKGDKEIGPTECAKCHTGKYKNLAELEKVTRPKRKQKDTTFIAIDSSRMKGVPFDHKAHEMSSKTCRTCHHETLKACKECHSLTGKPEGNGINTATAYHRALSDHSCAGCHNKMKAQKKCWGCHYNIPAVDIDSVSPRKETCGTCHTGKKDKITMPKTFSTAGISQDKLKKEVTVKVLEKEYEPSKFPHLDMVNKLVKVSNDSKLALYFHKDIQTLCDGCHHKSPEAAEAQKDTPPYCRNCHMIAYDKEHLNNVRLLSAYHRQCLGCHDKMSLEKGRKCSDCHKKKKGGPAEITHGKNENVVMQNKETILNVWKPK